MIQWRGSAGSCLTRPFKTCFKMSHLSSVYCHAEYLMFQRHTLGLTSHPSPNSCKSHLKLFTFVIGTSEEVESERQRQEDVPGGCESVEGLL